MRAICCLLLSLLAVSVVEGGERLKLLSEEAPPANYVDDTGQPAGTAVDIVREICARLDHPRSIQILPWKRAYIMAQTQADVALFSTTRTPAREKLFKWVGPIVVTRWVFYARADSPIRIETLDDARKVERIGTYRADARDEYLRKLAFPNIESASDNGSNIKKLLGNRIDLWAASTTSALMLCKQHRIDPNRIKPVFTIKKAFLYIAFSLKTPDETVRKWQETLDTIKREGLFEEIYSRHVPGEDLSEMLPADMQSAQ